MNPRGNLAKCEQCIKCGSQEGDRFARGLCIRCYNAARHRGTLDAEGLPRRPNTRPIGDRKLEASGYVTIKTERGIIYEHRLVMERILGRHLLRNESAHHVNGIRSDNRPENLELWFVPQPAGQRVAELIAYIAEFHAGAVIAAITDEPSAESLARLVIG
jgi:hypothetical protein